MSHVLKMVKIRHHAVIEFFVKKGLVVIEIHKEMCYKMLHLKKQWFVRGLSSFNVVLTIIEGDPCSGYPKSSTTLDIIKERSYTVFEDR